jgi:hypoxanthine phosphoribosyltransferase
MIQLHDKQFVPFLSAKEIAHAIAKMTAQVEADFKDEVPVL